MKRIVALFAIAIVTLQSCSKIFDTSVLERNIIELKDRVTSLEEQCKQMNTNISSLQTILIAMQNNDYVTGITPIVLSGVEVGYTITFSKSGAITIYHGEDGKDGTDGKDGKDGVDGTNGKDGVNGADGKDGQNGATPVIGVKQDTDGVYYWTLNGEWLLNDKGEKVKAVGTDSKDGENGANGKDGVDGKDGITPQLKIEDDYWYISYDNGTTWTQLGKAKGEDGQDGTDGSDGTDGDSIFTSITQDDEYVYFNLVDGSVIILTKTPNMNTECNKIYYTTSDGKRMWPYTTEPFVFGAMLVSNTYNNGQGVLTFDGPILTIGKGAFYDRDNLINIIIPESVETIGMGAFGDDYGLNLYCKAMTPPTIYHTSYAVHSSLEGCSLFSSMGNIYVPRNSLEIYKTAWGHCVPDYNFYPYDFE